MFGFFHLQKQEPHTSVKLVLKDHSYCTVIKNIPTIYCNTDSFLIYFTFFLWLRRYLVCKFASCCCGTLFMIYSLVLNFITNHLVVMLFSLCWTTIIFKAHNVFIKLVVSCLTASCLLESWSIGNSLVIIIFLSFHCQWTNHQFVIIFFFPNWFLKVKT